MEKFDFDLRYVSNECETPREKLTTIGVKTSEIKRGTF